MSHFDFTKVQYKRLASAYRARNIAFMSYHFTNLTLRYGGNFATELAQSIEKSHKHWNKTFSNQIMIRDYPDSYTAFLAKSVAKSPFSLWLAIKRNKKSETFKNASWSPMRRELVRRNEIRKQEEAPEVKTKGAESSIELCDSCKNTFKSDHDVCPDCELMGDL
ncbi:hypothetical protein [Vibrio cincinnatiensis]|uniref:hypothetical protein n=1 Tax=Vibrio cincinnatiensis TaxID=675 RepID=UPI001EDD6985|nr:hypothetical protein [Vibrio cincinnatiensis]MCG3728997.1 hypothetical protein [Vibrio cincinnatiensis]